jgi:hypothetical protein
MIDRYDPGDTMWSLGAVGGADAVHETDPGVVRAQYDPEVTDSLCYTLVRAVAAATEQELEQLPPVHSMVDLEAVTTLVESVTDSPLEMTFEYEECAITLNAEGALLVQPDS